MPEGLYSVQVVARAKTGNGERATLATTLPLVDRLPSGADPMANPSSSEKTRDVCPRP